MFLVEPDKLNIKRPHCCAKALSTPVFGIRVLFIYISFMLSAYKERMTKRKKERKIILNSQVRKERMVKQTGKGEDREKIT